jgi:hypothetical protein
MTDAPKNTRRNHIVERNGRVYAFDRENQLIGTFPTRIEATCALNLVQQADAILKGARFDIMTGGEQDRRYRRKKRAESKRLARLWRARNKKLGKFGGASRVRNIRRTVAEMSGAEGDDPPPAPGDT